MMSDRTVVSLKNIHKTYRLGEVRVPALKGVDLDVHAGEFTAVIGASGSGKSTLLNMIGCIDNPDSGEVWIEGTHVERLTDNQKSDLRNQKIGFIFQSFNLVPILSVYENIELPLLINSKVSSKDRHRSVEEAIADVGLQSFTKNRPEQLSGGQRQRVAIARALASQPTLVLADEPTANLDSDTSNKIIDLMIDLNKRKGLTFLFSTHDERLMKKVSRIVHIKDGMIEK